MEVIFLIDLSYPQELEFQWASSKSQTVEALTRSMELEEKVGELQALLRQVNNLLTQETVLRSLSKADKSLYESVMGWGIV